LAALEPARPAALGRSRLERALAEDELTLFCQPIRHLATHAYPLAEVLVRLRDEEKALIPPGEFLPVFEELGMMSELDRWVTRHAIARLKAGSRIRALSVNLAGQTIADASFPGFVAKELATAGVAPGALVFEIDEGDLAAGMEHAVQAADALHRAGCRVLIDSFGSTARALEHLKQLRVDLVKVDGAVVRKVLASSGTRNLLSAVLRLAAALELGVIGACVEEEDVLLRLKALGVGYVQGFGVHQPGPLDKLAGPTR